MQLSDIIKLLRGVDEENLEKTIRQNPEIMAFLEENEASVKELIDFIRTQELSDAIDTADASGKSGGGSRYSDNAGDPLAGLTAEGPIDPTPFPFAAPDPEFSVEPIPEEDSVPTLTPPVILPDPVVPPIDITPPLPPLVDEPDDIPEDPPEDPEDPPEDPEDPTVGGRWFIAQADNHDRQSTPDKTIEEGGRNWTFNVIYQGNGNYPIALGETVVVTMDLWYPNGMDQATFEEDYELALAGIGQFDVVGWEIVDGQLIVTIEANKDGANLTGSVFKVTIDALSDEVDDDGEVVGFDFTDAVHGDVTVGEGWETNDDVLIEIGEDDSNDPPEDPEDPPEDPEDPTDIPHGISNVVYELENGLLVKIDEYAGDVKDPTDPQQYVEAIEEHFGQTVVTYTIKAGQGYYDPLGNEVDPIDHSAVNWETTQQGALDGNWDEGKLGGEVADPTVYVFGSDFNLGDILDDFDVDNDTLDLDELFDNLNVETSDREVTIEKGDGNDAEVHVDDDGSDLTVVTIDSGWPQLDVLNVDVGTNE